MSERNEATQVAVIGAGPGGYAAAFAAADQGLRVTLIDEDARLGGVCLQRGCIPSKALLHAAQVLREARRAAGFGIEFGPPKIDLGKLRAWKNRVIEKLTGGLGQLARDRRITYLQGRASFESGTSLFVALAGGGRLRLEFEHAILATGSRPVKLPIAPDSPRVMDSTRALELEEIPKTLLVVGGGYIGLELATVYAALGSKVSLVEMTDGLLPGADRDLVRPLAARMKSELHQLMLNTRVAEMHDTGEKVRVRFEAAGASAGAGGAGGGAGTSGEQEYDRVLIAVGRRPNTEGLGLENTRVEVDERGFVKVDAQRRTAEPTIFAIGDVAGEPMLAHKASHEGKVAAEAIAGRRVAFEPRAIPAVVYTDPEIAWCGLTESQAKAEGRAVKVVRFPWGASGRAATLDRADGVTKLIVDPETEHVLGVGISGPGAGELIAEGVLAVEMAAVAADVMLTIHPHPTLSETVMEAAELIYGQSTHFYRKG